MAKAKAPRLESFRTWSSLPPTLLEEVRVWDFSPELPSTWTAGLLSLQVWNQSSRTSRRSHRSTEKLAETSWGHLWQDQGSLQCLFTTNIVSSPLCPWPHPTSPLVHNPETYHTLWQLFHFWDLGPGTWVPAPDPDFLSVGTHRHFYLYMLLPDTGPGTQYHTSSSEPMKASQKTTAPMTRHLEQYVYGFLKWLSMFSRLDETEKRGKTLSSFSKKFVPDHSTSSRWIYSRSKSGLSLGWHWVLQNLHFYTW